MPASCVLGVWPGVARWIEAGLRPARGRLTSGDVLAACLTGGMDLWLAGAHGAVVTEWRDYPGGRALVGVVIGGAGGEWIAVTEVLKAIGRAGGARWFEFSGRRGWARRLRGAVEVSGITYEVEL